MSITTRLAASAPTHIREEGVSDAVFERVRTLSEKEISDFAFEIMAINRWNRANAGVRNVPGSLYMVGDNDQVRSTTTILSG